LEREVRSVQVCSSPYIPKFFALDTFQYSNQEYLIILEEYLSNGTLTEKLSSGPLNNNEAVNLGVSMLSAIKEMCAYKLVHRDIKPDNIIYRSEYEPVLVDFGLVRDLTASSLTHTWINQGPGTPFFAAPEQLNNDKHLIDWKTDQFSLGLVLAICLSGRHPYDDGLGPDSTVLNVAERKNHPIGFSKLLPGCWHTILSKMTAVWPHQRYNQISRLIDEIKTCGG